MDKIFKVALVGCGTISGNHIRALLDVPYAKIVAICDKVPEKAEGKKAEFGLDAKVYDNYEKMLECEDLDSVHIATPHYLHASMAIAALKKNINVFLEKPICISREEIDALKAAEAESSARVCVCFQNRFNPSTVLAKSLLMRTAELFRHSERFSGTEVKNTIPRADGAALMQPRAEAL